MTLDEFWNLIEAARSDSADCETIAENLRTALLELQPAEIIEFDRHLWERLAESYRWDLWAVAFIVNGGCSDDGFEYFRGWLISQGRAYFEAAMQNPERAADRAEPDFNECEDILYVAPRAYEELTGQSMPLVRNALPPGGPTGVPWEESELDDLYPNLTKRFS